ncbi:MAG: GumC family protein, partial [Asticcacaulis sp.]
MNFVQNQVEPDTSDIQLPTIDLNAIVADFRRFSRFFLAIFVITLLAIIVPGLVQPPKYTAQSTVMVDPRTLNAAPAEDVLSGLPADTTTIDTEAEVLKSNSLAERVIKSLKLDEDPEFNVALRHNVLTSLGGDKALTPIEQQKQHEKVVAKVLKRLDVKRSGLTRIINIDFTASTPEKAARVANEWARLYLSQQLETKFQATQEANNWLSGRLGDLKTQVEQAETAVQQYKISHGIMNTTDNNTIAQSEIATLDQQLATVKVDQAESQARLEVAKKQLASGSTGEDVGEALNSDVIKSLRAQRAQVSQHVADLETRYGPLHPDIIKAKRQLDDIDVQIKAEIKRLISNLEAQAQIQRQRTASLQASVGAARGNLAGNNEAMVKLNELQRNADAVSSLYQSYLDRFKQTTSQAGLDKT